MMRMTGWMPDPHDAEPPDDACLGYDDCCDCEHHNDCDLETDRNKEE